MSFCIYLLSDRKGLYYVGKTTNIKSRLIRHKTDIRHQGTCSSRYLDIDFDVEILEEYSSELDLAQGERKYYDIYREKMGDKLVNICQPLRTPVEYHAEWRAENHDKYKAQRKQHYAENADKIKARVNQYRTEHAELIKAKANQKHTCECGGRYTCANKTQHFKSLQHSGSNRRLD